MITVIADDLTGAAELAGIGLRYRLKTELSFKTVESSEADLFVVCTDSRSMGRKESLDITREVLEKIKARNSSWVYKKIDSVFRGHVLDELKLEMETLGLNRALIIAANPSMGRTIKNGKYFIEGEPISETDFATDPEFAMKDSSVLSMVKARTGEAVIMSTKDGLPASGIVIGEAISTEEVAAWAGSIDHSWMLAGAGDFFIELLNKEQSAKPVEEASVNLPLLYVSGTSFGNSQAFIRQVGRHLDCVSYLPPIMMETGRSSNEAWYDDVTGKLLRHGKAIVAINEEDVNPWNVSPVYLRAIMARAARKILERGAVKEVFIEGGSTAASLIEELGITKLEIVNELRRGVVRMKANNVFITVKPGSYELPSEIKEIFKSN